MNRRHFIKQTALASSAVMASSMAGASLLNAQGIPEQSLLTILHTNDWHSRIEPFPEIDKQNAGKGGAAFGGEGGKGGCCR